MGFGFGSAIIGQIAPFMIPEVTTAADGALQVANANMGLATTFYIFGAVFFVLLVIAAQFLNNPPAGWTPPVPANQAKAAAPAAAAVTLGGALGMYQFYILWLLLFLNVTAGIALISNLSVMAQDACAVTAVTAGTVIFVSSLFNGLGRIFWASLSDKIGRKAVFAILFGTQIPLFFILPQITNIILFSVIACYILACYGGGFASMPAYAADTFGAANMGQIYGKILLAWAAAGAVGPMLMEYIKKSSGSFKMAVFVAGGMLILGFVLNLLYRKPQAVKN
jgi:OFA family oxalate/formate antiporter-like MFS transporter